MLAYLEGTVLYHGKGYVIVKRDGVGYKVSFPEPAASLLNGEVTMYLHEVIRDHERELFGFSQIEQMELFWKLIAISGVGPRGAQKIVCSGPVEKVKKLIMSADLAMLTDVPGVGKKTAQKIILELKGVLTDELGSAVSDQDAVDGLIGIGYSRKDAEAALSGLEGGSTEDLIRQALKRMAR
jgi:holliday junction DNA helicase RuvA